MNDVPPENEYAFWITLQIKEYFEKLGFHVIPIAISQHQERTEPYDWRYELQELDKMFALQFKRPYPYTNKIAWELTRHQHNAMRSKRYIFYCLPKSQDRSEMPIMLHRCIFKRASFPFVSILYARSLGYCDGWGSFASKVLSCVYGARLTQFKNRIYDEIQIDMKEPIVAYGLSLSGKALKILVPENLFKEFDFKFEKII